MIVQAGRRFRPGGYACSWTPLTGALPTNLACNMRGNPGFLAGSRCMSSATIGSRRFSGSARPVRAAAWRHAGITADAVTILAKEFWKE
jgi:hypothetical protein